MKNTSQATFCRRAGRVLLLLYPAVWRERYAEEMLQILEDTSPTFLTLCNLVISLIDAYAHSNLLQRGNRQMLHSMRAHGFAIYGATLLFFVAWFYEQAHVHAPYQSQSLLDFFLPSHHSLLLSLVHATTTFFLLALVLGGFPLLLAASWNAWKDRNLRALVFCLLGLVSPVVTALLTVLLWIPLTLMQIPFLLAPFVVMIGLAGDLALMFFAIEQVAPSRRVTSYALSLALLIPLVMFIGLLTLVPAILPSFHHPGNDPWYILRQGLMLLVMGATFVCSIVALQQGFQTKRLLQTPPNEEGAIM